jgi:hypothetical protein
MQISLEPMEAQLLRSILEQHLGDLRMEIGKTESYDMRNDLKHNEEMLNNILGRLALQTPTP